MKLRRWRPGGWAVGLMLAAGVGLAVTRSPIGLARESALAFEPGGLWPRLSGCEPVTATLQALTMVSGGGGYVPGLAAASRGEWASAAQWLADEYAARPRDLTAAYLGAVALRRGDHDAAARWWVDNSEAARLLVALAQACEAAAQPERMAEYYRLAARYVQRPWTTSHADIVLFLAAHGSPAELDAVLARLDGALSVEALQTLGAALQQQKRPVEAAAYFERAATLADQDVNAVRLAAQAHLQAGQLDAARQWSERALRMAADHQRDYFTLGQIADRAGQLDEAYAWFERAGGVKALLNQARIRLRQARNAEAAELYRLVLQLEPGNEAALTGLQRLGLQP